MAHGTDILMITYNRARYTRLALSKLLERCDDSMRVWVWQNGSDPETMAVVDELRDHPRMHRYHHSPENVRLTTPTNWLWKNASGDYLSKVDDDCIVPEDWGALLRQAHEDEPRFGVIGCWRFQEEDFVPRLAERKIRGFGGGHRLLVNLWVEGSGYLMKRACLNRFGPLKEGQSFTDYCIQIGRVGWFNGWIYPFLYQEHMDDPRAANSGLASDADLERYLPLSAKRNGVTSVAEWLEQLKRSARRVQVASADPAYWSPTRRRLRRIGRRIKHLITGRKSEW